MEEDKKLAKEVTEEKELEDAKEIKEEMKKAEIVSEIDPSSHHRFQIGVKGCYICGRKQKHTIHRSRRTGEYEEGQVINKRYVVGKNGEFHRIPDYEK
jgi:hypothetical protein